MARGKINAIKLIQLGSRQMQNVSPKAIPSIKLRSKPISMRKTTKSPKYAFLEPTFTNNLSQMKTGLEEDSLEALLSRVEPLHGPNPLIWWMIFIVKGILQTSRGTGDAKNVGLGMLVAVEAAKCADNCITSKTRDPS